MTHGAVCHVIQVFNFFTKDTCLIFSFTLPYALYFFLKQEDIKKWIKVGDFTLHFKEYAEVQKIRHMLLSVIQDILQMARLSFLF